MTHLPFQEVGFGENTAMDTKVKNDESAIKRALSEKVAAITGFTKQVKEELEHILHINFATFGLEGSVCAMSELTPIECTLFPHHPQILATPR